MAEDPKVSVVIGTRNGGPYLAEQLTSILNQSRPVDEIVLTDDASSDRTVEIAHDLVGARAGAPDLMVLRNEPPLGVTANFEQGLAAATGDILILCDQDDRWHPDRVARALARFADRPDTLLVHSDAALVSGDGTPLGATLFEALEIGASDVATIRSGGAAGLLLRRNLVTGATAAIRRQLLETARPFPASWVHDEWLAMLASLTGRIDVIGDPLIDYRQHGANQIGVAVPTLGHKLRRVLAPRGDRNAVLAARAAALLERLTVVGGFPEETLAAVAGKVRHETFRSSLPASRIRRLAPVLRELRAGGYDRFSSRGKADVVRDLLQPS